MRLPTVTGFPSQTRFACGFAAVPGPRTWAVRVGRPCARRLLLVNVTRFGSRVRVSADVRGGRGAAESVRRAFDLPQGLLG